MTFRVEKPIGENAFVVDDLTGAKLINRRSSPEMPHQLDLIFGGKIITMDVSDNVKFLADEKIEVSWKILRVYDENSAPDYKEEISSLVARALEAYGRGGQRERVKKVTVDFSKTQWGLK